MARPFWSGQIQISLVSFGVKLFVATEAKSEIHFHQIDRSSGERVRHQKVLASALERNPDEATDQSEVVERSQIVKGYEYAKGRYVTLEPEEIADLRVSSKHTMEITQFVDNGSIAPEFFEKPYFVVPENATATEAFLTVRKALVDTKKIGLSKIAFGGREHIVALSPAGLDSHPGMVAYTMRYTAELRDPEEYFRAIKPMHLQGDSVALAKELIKKKSTKFDPDKFVDGYEVALKKLVDAKLKRAPLPREETPALQRGKVINLMDALRKSVQSKSSSSETRGISSARKSAAHKGPVLVNNNLSKSSKSVKSTHTRRKSA